MLETTFRADLVAVSGLASSQIHFSNAPEGLAKPYIIINRISGAREYTTEGYAGASLSRIQVDVYANDYPAAKTEANNVYALHTSNSFKAIEIENEFDEYDDTLGTYRVSIDFLIFEED